MMLNNSNINNTIAYPMQPYNTTTTTTAPLPAQGYYVLGQPYPSQHYHTPSIYISSAVPFAQVGVPQTTTATATGATITTTAASNNIPNYSTMGLNPSGSLTTSTSNTQLPPIQIMLNSNFENTTTSTDTTPVSLASSSTNHSLTPNITTKGSSAAAAATAVSSSPSPATNSIVLPPLGFANTPTHTPVTTPVPICTSAPSPTPSIKNYTPGAISVQSIDQKHHLPYLSTQFRPHEITSVTGSASSNRLSSLMFKDNNLAQGIMTNPVSINSSSTKQQSKKNFSFVPQSNDYHIAKNGSIMKKSNLLPKSIIGRPTTISTVDNNNNNNQATSRKRRRTTKEQRQILKEAFMKNKAPSKEERLSLAQQCNMSEKSIQVWFQNQRQYMRREQNLRALQYFQIIT